MSTPNRFRHTTAILALLGTHLLGCNNNAPTPPPTAPIAEDAAASNFAPDTSIPDTSIPDTSIPDTSIPDTSIPDTSIPDASILNAKFLDEVVSNREDDGAISDLEFIDANGTAVNLQQYKGKQNVLLVFTRGFSGQICPYCTTQTSRLIANYEKFRAFNTEVLLVYPGSKSQLPMFKQASIESSGKNSFPFPVLLDEDLAAVDRLGIAAELAYPSTFILDKQGRVRLSYVGSNPTDRPSIKALLAQLAALD